MFLKKTLTFIALAFVTISVFAQELPSTLEIKNFREMLPENFPNVYHSRPLNFEQKPNQFAMIKPKNFIPISYKGEEREKIESLLKQLQLACPDCNQIRKRLVIYTRPFASAHGNSVSISTSGWTLCSSNILM